MRPLLVSAPKARCRFIIESNEPVNFAVVAVLKIEAEMLRVLICAQLGEEISECFFMSLYPERRCFSRLFFHSFSLPRELFAGFIINAETCPS